MNNELNLTVAPARGNVKAAMKSAGAKSSDLWQVDPRQVRVMTGFNVRERTPEYEQHIEAITQSIIANGYYPDKPMAGFVARENGENIIYVTDGHSRHEAVMAAIERGHMIETVPIVIKPAGTSMEDLTVALVKSNEGRPLNPMEIGTVCKRLLGMGLDEKIIAQRLGFSRNYIDDVLTLVGADKAVRDMVTTGQIAATLAIQELKQDPERAPERLQRAIQTAQSLGKEKATRKHLPPSATPAPKKPASNAATIPTHPEQDGTDTDAEHNTRHQGLPSAEEICKDRPYPILMPEVLAELLKQMTPINMQWDQLVEVTKPNKHGVFVRHAIISSPIIKGCQLEIGIAKGEDGWRACLTSYTWHMRHGGGGASPISTLNKPSRNALEALAKAAREADAHISATLHRHADHAPTAQAARAMQQWLSELRPDVTPYLPSKEEAK